MSKTAPPSAQTRRPLKLRPVNIPKPWGQEIWYTGMEARGESQIELASGWTDLSDYLQQFPEATDGQALLLLKILDPAPEEVVGDLYFEVHEEKREVYIVTHVDSQAWPHGKGQIRFGMNQALRARYADDAAFRQDYLQAVQAYEKVRRTLDGETTDTPAPNTHDEADVPQSSAQKEQVLRARMEAFTEVRELSVGDVIAVPTWTPHSLQHGVRVVEFQTQTYERYIISFAQKVLTQNHWDTAHAVANMHVDAPAAAVFETVSPGVERIARFEDFNVWRCQAPSDMALPGNIPYLVAMALGHTRIGALTLQHEEAALIPRDALANARIDSAHTVLLAAPGL